MDFRFAYRWPTLHSDGKFSHEVRYGFGDVRVLENRIDGFVVAIIIVHHMYVHKFSVVYP